MANILLLPLLYILNTDLLNKIKNHRHEVEWHQCQCYIFIQKTYQKAHLALTKQYVSTVTCLFLQEGKPHLNYDEASQYRLLL